MKSLLTVLGVFYATHLVLAQRTQEICHGLPGGTGFVNDFAACDAYFSCIRGRAYPARCPFPFVFNPSGPFGPICDYPFNVACKQCPEKGVLNVPNPYFCGKYTQCISGVAIERECAPGTAFNRDEGTCVPDNEASCAEINVCGKLEGGTGSAPSTRYCEKFVICSNGEAVGEEYTCPQGMKFDSKHMRCALSDDAVCHPGTISQANLLLAPIAMLP